MYFATYEAVKHAMGGNKAGEHHPLAAGKSLLPTCEQGNSLLTINSIATSGAAATIASDAFMNPFDGN